MSAATPNHPSFSAFFAELPAKATRIFVVEGGGRELCFAERRCPRSKRHPDEEAEECSGEEQ